MTRAGSKDVRDLVRRFRPGYSLVDARRGYHGVVDPDGRPVRYPDGRPIILPNTPNTRGSAVWNYQRDLERAGVIEPDSQA